MIPWRGYVRLKKLLALPSVDSKEKLALYAVTIAFQWVLVGVVTWRAIARGLTLQAMGLGVQSWGGDSFGWRSGRSFNWRVAVVESAAHRKDGGRGA